MPETHFLRKAWGLNMARKIKLHGQFSKPLAEVFEDFVISQTAQGLSEITIATYRHHLHSISNHLDSITRQKKREKGGKYRPSQSHFLNARKHRYANKKKINAITSRITELR